LAENWRDHADDTQSEICYSCIVQNCGQGKKPLPKTKTRVFEETAFLCPKSKKGGMHMTHNHAITRRLSKKLRIFAPSGSGPEKTKDASDRAARFRRRLYWSLVAVTAAFILSFQPVFAADVWTEFSKIMKDVYGKPVGISTIVAVTAASVALLVRMISRNQRAVDEASSWLKRILVTWVVLNTLGFIVAYLQPLISGGGYTGP
jgi:hypothetical protein